MDKDHKERKHVCKFLYHKDKKSLYVLQITHFQECYSCKNYENDHMLEL